MRNEALAKRDVENGSPCLLAYCYVSGGILFGKAGWRESIFRQHMPMEVVAFRHGDQDFFISHPELDEATIWVHFHRSRSCQDKVEDWGQPHDYRLNPLRSSTELMISSI